MTNRTNKEEENQVEFDSNELIDSIWLQNKRIDPVREGFTLFAIHLFFGLGMFYINPRNGRKWIYPILAFFAWGSFINVFIKVIPAMEEFQNRSLIGALTIIVSWFIVYGIGYFDVYRELYLKSKRKGY
ncbi:MAG: hypothetical protein AB8B56_00545 [Crocinitomicaceae bacterium]